MLLLNLGQCKTTVQVRRPSTSGVPIKVQVFQPDAFSLHLAELRIPSHCGALLRSRAMSMTQRADRIWFKLNIDRSSRRNATRART